MTAVEALELAMTKEQNAIDLYERMAEKYPEIRELLLSLVIEEQKHKKLIQDKIVEITRY
jgi:rubrerythrin